MALPRSTHISRLYPLFLGLTVLVVLLLASRYLSTKIVFQITGSMPRGIYIIATPQKIDRGQTIIFSLPQSIRGMIEDRQWVPPNVSMLMKDVYGVPDDMILVNDKGLSINGEHLGSVKKYDNQGLPLAQQNRDMEYRLKDAEYFAACPSDNSYDSRYFGPVHRKHIKGVVRPLWILDR